MVAGGQNWIGGDGPSGEREERLYGPARADDIRHEVETERRQSRQTDAPARSAKRGGDSRNRQAEDEGMTERVVVSVVEVGAEEHKDTVYIR